MLSICWQRCFKWRLLSKLRNSFLPTPPSTAKSLSSYPSFRRSRQSKALSKLLRDRLLTKGYLKKVFCGKISQNRSLLGKTILLRSHTTPPLTRLKVVLRVATARPAPPQKDLSIRGQVLTRVLEQLSKATQVKIINTQIYHPKTDKVVTKTLHTADRSPVLRLLRLRHPKVYWLMEINNKVPLQIWIQIQIVIWRPLKPWSRNEFRCRARALLKKASSRRVEQQTTDNSIMVRIRFLAMPTTKISPTKIEDLAQPNLSKSKDRAQPSHTTKKSQVELCK